MAPPQQADKSTSTVSCVSQIESSRSRACVLIGSKLDVGAAHVESMRSGGFGANWSFRRPCSRYTMQSVRLIAPCKHVYPRKGPYRNVCFCVSLKELPSYMRSWCVFAGARLPLSRLFLRLLRKSFFLVKKGTEACATMWRRAPASGTGGNRPGSSRAGSGEALKGSLKHERNVLRSSGRTLPSSSWPRSLSPSCLL